MIERTNGAPRRRSRRSVSWRLWLVLSGWALGGALLGTTPASAGVLDISWTAPTTKTDGSRLTNLAFYRIYYRAAVGGQAASVVEVASATPSPEPNQAVSFRITGLATGTLYNIVVTAVDTGGREGETSAIVSAIAQIDFSVSPAGPLDFGNVNVGSSAERTFQVQNTRGATVAGTASVPAPFSIVSGSPFTLVGAGATQAITVRFTPTALVTSSANVSVSADGDTRVLPVTGVGIDDTTPPSVVITLPTSASTHSTNVATLTLAGTASDNTEVTSVTWVNSRGGSGTAAGTTSWTASGIALQAGVNVITVTATDAAGATSTATLTVTRDVVAPTVAITSPTSGSTYSTSGSILTLGGTASDDLGAVQVTWANHRGGSGTATGTTSWTASDIVLQLGTNVLTVTARDTAGNTASATLTVTSDVAPPTIAITSPTSGATHSTSNPLLMLRGVASDDLGVTQVTWANSRGGGGVAVGTGTWITGAIALRLGENVLTVTARDVIGNTATTTVTVTLAGPFAFTDDPLTAQSVAVMALHVLELRAAVDSVRVARGLALFAWTDPVLIPGVTPVRIVHLAELRIAVGEACQVGGVQSGCGGFSDPTPEAGVTIIRALHLNELRSAVRASMP